MWSFIKIVHKPFSIFELLSIFKSLGLLLTNHDINKVSLWVKKELTEGSICAAKYEI